MSNSETHGRHTLRREILIGVISAGLAIFGAYTIARHTESVASASERAALTSEAEYLCHAMSWQAVYMASDQDPESWRRATNNSGLLNFKDPNHAWNRPSWFPFRTPLWTALKDKIGALEPDDARRFADFFNRVEFLDVLRIRRHCFNRPDPEFLHMYMCTLMSAVNLCRNLKYDDPANPRSKNPIEFVDQFKAIHDQLQSGICANWQNSTVKQQVECDTDSWPQKPQNAGH